MLRFVTIWLRACLVLALAVHAAACAEKISDEERIRRALHEAVRHVEQGDVAAAGALLADDYADQAGRTPQQLKGTLLFALRRGPVLIVLQDIVVSVAGDQARATFAAYAVQGAAEVQTPRDLLPQRARKLSLTTEWRRDGKDWRVTSIAGDGDARDGSGSRR